MGIQEVDANESVRGEKYRMERERQKIKIPTITLEWKEWVTWDALQQSTAMVYKAPGVYEVKYKDATEPARRLHIGKAGNTQSLRERIRKMVHGGAHSAGKDILAHEVPTVGAENIVVRWAVTDRPAAVEEELHNLYKKQFGGDLPRYDDHT